MQLSTPAFLFSGLVCFLSAFLFLVSFSFYLSPSVPLYIYLSLCPLLLLLRLPSSVSGSTTFSVSAPFFCDSLLCCLWFWRLVAEDCEDDGSCRFLSLRFRPLGWVCVSFAPGFYILSPSVLRWWDKDDGGADPRLCVVPLLFLSFSVSLFFFLCYSFSVPPVCFTCFFSVQLCEFLFSAVRGFSFFFSPGAQSFYGFYSQRKQCRFFQP